MAEESTQGDAASANAPLTWEENLRRWRVSRRRLLKIVGLGAVATAAAAVLPGVLVKREGASAQEQATAQGQRLRKWAMVIDLRHCDGCQSIGEPPRCTAACIEGHFAPEPMEWIEVFEQEMEGGGTRFLPTPCQQCESAPCVNVCPVAATFTTPEGIVLIDQNRCIGCRMCMAACPYDRRFFNWGQPPIPAQAALADYHVEQQIPAQRGTVMKCDFCPDMARAGRLPFCVQACPQNAIYYGDLEEDIATNGREVVKLTKFLAENNTFRQKEELGTQPRVHYIPGHGEAVGRDPHKTGRLPTAWRWQQIAEKARRWQR
ncbi:MAG: 4Fe-4S dicluster domain-containing protein [Chloroflexi bacterium]|nr:4Fe-4S dicluster domain-containing protein [Chloroflexota bacterium]